MKFNEIWKSVRVSPCQISKLFITMSDYNHKETDRHRKREDRKKFSATLSHADIQSETSDVVQI